MMAQLSSGANVQNFASESLLNEQIMAGMYRRASETPFQWRFAGVPIVAQDCVLAGYLRPYLVCVSNKVYGCASSLHP